MATTLKGIHKIKEKMTKPLSPTRTITISFALVILVGTLLLLLPISTKDGLTTTPLDALFSATSATCVTGLVVFDTYLHWTFFGQGVLLGLIQIGGIGLVTLTTFFTLALRHKIGLSGMILARESVGSNSIIDLTQLIRLVIFSTIFVETIGALLLMTQFIPMYGTQGVWTSIFLAVSAYCNAGFDILGHESPFASLTNHTDNVVINVTIMSLIVIGGLGFIVFQDILNHGKSKRLMLHTKVVLLGTAFLIVSGAALFFILESQNPDTMKNMPLGEKIMASFFQSITTRTAGFNSINLANIQDPTKLIMSLLMFIGAAPGSTGGGIKVTTFMVLVMTVVATLRNKNETTIMRRKIDHAVVYRALSTAMLALIVCIITVSIIVGQHDGGVVDAIFEGVSAFGTVGCTAGLTPNLSDISQIAVILTMFIGRVGPFSFILAISLRHSNNPRNLVLPEGQIIVG